MPRRLGYTTRQNHQPRRACDGPESDGDAGQGAIDGPRTEEWPWRNGPRPGSGQTGKGQGCRQYAESKDMSHGIAAGRFMGREKTGQAALRDKMAGRKSMRRLGCRRRVLWHSCCKTDRKRAPQEHDAEAVRPDRRQPQGMPSREDLVRMEKPARAACCSCKTMRDGGVQSASFQRKDAKAGSPAGKPPHQRCGCRRRVVPARPGNCRVWASTGKPAMRDIQDSAELVDR